ncbi:endo-1,4-beta-xylanase [Roseococcus sp. SDR]|uniref:endo-1,4-beta-xylanase n=1 Tax=Roseococcus sp. SDR TaxID=2835532 RepID=UPI001BD09E35|nr:endo-1,4-beta-xylanase [Roseococcus sp. SDR]MBS7791984.1 endo-1,4-beta-xylanase [Roseococcus sp. SDR]MBV1847298.1 endo-1,4-beta-xylanase [Roseococcus sp. SDR]
MRLARRALLGTPLAATALAQEPGLRALAEARGLVIGNMVTRGQLRDHPALQPLLRRDAALITPGLELKWDTLRPDPESFNFAPAEEVAAFTLAGGMDLRGHTLVWHEALPRWFDPAAMPAPQLRATLERHIRTVAGHFQGRIASWDVVNEPIGENGLRDGPHSDPDLIRQAFLWAREADPGARLVINDYDLELGDRRQDGRRTAMLRLLERLLRAGAPVGALGIQAHLAPRSAPFDAARLARFLRDVAGMGLAIEVTELDIVDRLLPADIAARDAEGAAMAADFLRVALDQPAVRMLVLWGLSDVQAWQQDSAFARRRDGLPSRSHPLDREMAKKPLWHAIAGALRA